MLKIDNLVHEILEAMTTVEPVPGLPGVVEYAAKSGSGLTIDVIYGGVPNTGYAVSLAGYEVNVAANVLPLALRQYIRAYMPLLEKYWLGLWEKDGRIYLDVTTIEESFEEALKLARENKQIAFYHLDTDTTHFTADYRA